MNRKNGLKTPINELSFYYNRLASEIADDIFDNLNDGIKWDQTQYEWPYDLLIDKEGDFRYLNFTYSVERIPTEDFINESGKRVFVYKTKKYGIPCERKFELNQNNIIESFTSSGCI